MTSSLFDITGRLALVTGSSRGLGLALATGLARAGARVVLHGRNPDTLAAAAEQVGAVAAEQVDAGTGARPVSVPTVSFDVTDAAAVRDGVAALVAEHGVPDILVNNAGVQSRAPFTEFAEDEWERVISSSLSSIFHVSRQVTPGMVARGSGKVINIGSVMSQLARQTVAAYGASKGGVAMLTKGMAADLARHNVQVNTISPGYFATEMTAPLVADEEFNAWVVDRTPARRWGRPDELVGTLVYLASDASTFVSGQNVFVDGGMTSVV